MMMSKPRIRKEKRKRDLERELKDIIKIQNQMLAKTKLRRKENLKLYEKDKELKRRLEKMKRVFVNGENQKII